jgi:hypothetical protein
METILSFVPKEAKTQLKTLLEENGVPVIITKKRVTKHGDFRRKKNGEIAITINQTLNPYRFLITLIHELAHYQVYKTNGFNIKPHGEEWKNSFRMLALPFLTPQIFPDPLCRLFARYLKNPKASTDRDFELVMALRSHDPPSTKIALIDLDQGRQFKIDNGRIFVKLTRRRTRFECQEVASQKSYLFSPQAEVTPL